MRDIDLYNELDLGKSFIFNHKSVKLRNYQIEAIINLINQYVAGKNGYVWHCSGSGNSITAFKLAESFTKVEGVDKVVLLSSRYDAAFSNHKDLAKSSKSILNKFKNRDFFISFDTAFRSTFNSKKEELAKFSEDNIVFVFDDANLLANSRYLPEIQRIFKNSKFYGLFSMPKFNENADNGRTTAYNFDKRVGTYLLQDAFDDKNLVEIDVSFLDNVDLSDIKYSKKFFSYPKRINQIGRWIVENHDKLTENRKFQGMFMVYSVSSILKYYDFIKTTTDLNVVAILSKFRDNCEVMSDDAVEKFATKYILGDYNKKFNTNFTSKNIAKFKEDAYKRLENGEIDLLIVPLNYNKINMANVNTVYLDHKTIYNSLNLFSDINRPFNNKQSANLVIFTNLERNLTTRLKLYSNYAPNEKSELNSYDEYVGIINNKIRELLDFVDDKTGEIIASSKSDRKTFSRLHRQIKKYFSIVKGFVNYDDGDFLITEEYLNKLKLPVEKKKTSTRDSEKDIEDFELKEYAHIRINSQYLNSLNQN